MAKLDDAYKSFSDTQKAVSDKLLSLAKEFFPYIILLLNIAVSVVSRLFKAGLENPFSAEFFISLATNLLSTMFCYVCFISYGEKTEKSITPAYTENRARWSRLSGIVRNSHSEAFTKFCKAQVDSEREEKREEVLSNHTLISLETYNGKYKGVSKKKLTKLTRAGEISHTDAHYIKKADRVTVKPIKPLLILCGVKAGHINEAGRDGVSYSTLSIMSRPLVVFVTNAVITMISGSYIGIADASVIYDMIFLALLIVISSILGYSTGAASARKEHDKIKTRIFFLENFLENAPEMQSAVVSTGEKAVDNRKGV